MIQANLDRLETSSWYFGLLFTLWTRSCCIVVSQEQEALGLAATAGRAGITGYLPELANPVTSLTSVLG